MITRRSPNRNLRQYYALFVEAGLALSLATLIVLFRVPMASESEFEIVTTEQEIVLVEEIEQTRQIEQAPPPPAAPAPIEVPDNEIIDEHTLDLNMDLDLGERIALPPPPPAPVRAAPEAAEPEPEPEIFVVVEDPPELIGGLEGLQARAHYPEVARLAGIQGTVFVQLVIDEQGNATNLSCLRDPGAGLCEAALEVVKDAKFKPGKQRGRPVKVRFSLPVRYRLK